MEKRKKIQISLILIIILSTLFFFNNKSDVGEILINNDISQPLTHKSFISSPNFFEKKNQNYPSFNFVSETVNLIDNPFSNYGNNLNFKYIKSSGINYYPGLPTKATVGKLCDQQQLIRLTYCQNSYSKSSCKEDIFAKLWLINSPGDYIELSNYNPGNKFEKPFYYTYSCYELEKYKAITAPDNQEKRYLYNKKCISSENPNWKYGTNYFSEAKCIEALEKEREKAEIKSCSKEKFNDYICNGDRIYQLERQSDCDIEYTEYIKKCESGCDNGVCLSKPEKTCSYFEYDDFKCIDGIEYQKVRQRDCSEGYTLEVDICDQNSIIDDENETNNANNDNQNQTMDPAPIEGDEEDSILTCEAYEKVDGKKCKTDYISLLKSTDAVKDLYNDKPLEAGFIAVIILAVIGLIITIIN